MKKFFFVLMTLLIGLFLHIVFDRYFSISGISPNVLLILVVALGFTQGPLMAEFLGFLCGLVVDSIGVNLFGLHAVLLTVAGYTSGRFRRRIASERTTAQVAIAMIATGFYGLGVVILSSFFQGGPSRVGFFPLLLQMLFNVLIIRYVFLLMEWWLDTWNLEREHM